MSGNTWYKFNNKHSMELKKKSIYLTIRDRNDYLNSFLPKPIFFLYHLQ